MMDVLPVLARVAIGLVLLWAGISKLRSRTWPVLAMQMGTPRLVVLLLPAFEALLGLALVLQVTGGRLGWVAVIVFSAFTIVVVKQYLSGSDAPCNCFGGSGGQVVGKSTIARNAFLLVLALIATG